MKRALLLGVVVAVACDSPTEVQLNGLDAAHARWQAAGIVNYVFEVQHSCFCAPIVTRPITVTVVNGTPISITYSDSGTAADTTLFRQYLTVERIFAFLRSEVNAHPAVFAPVYDTSAGYPHQVFIDPIANAADDELTLHILSLQPLAPPP